MVPFFPNVFLLDAKSNFQQTGLLGKKITKNYLQRNEFGKMQLGKPCETVNKSVEFKFFLVSVAQRYAES